MGKRNEIKMNDTFLEDKIELGDFLDEPLDDEQEDVMAGIIKTLLETGNEQMMIALELTKLCLQGGEAKAPSQDKVFETFQRASYLVAENIPFKALLSQFNIEGEE